MTKKNFGSGIYYGNGGFQEKLDIRVSEDNLKRAYRIFNTLILQLEKRGFPVGMEDEYNKKVTFVKIQNQKIHIKMYEPQKRRFNPEIDKSKYGFDKYVFVPTNKFTLEIDEYFREGSNQHRAVRDTLNKKIEDRLNEFIIYLIQVSELHRIKEIQRKQEMLKGQELELKRRNLEKEINAEKEKVKEFELQVDAFYKSYQMRLYIQGVKENYEKQNGIIKEGSEMFKWLKWANEQADRVDPLKESPPSVLDREEELSGWYF